MDNRFFQLGMSVREDSLSWNESSSRRSKGCRQSADAHKVRGKLFEPESDISPCGTPKRHKIFLLALQFRRIEDNKEKAGVQYCLTDTP